MIRAANAPCSWGILEFDREAAAAPYTQVLDEIRAAGYAGTELGDWGFMPTDAARLQRETAERGLALVAAFVTVGLADPRTHGRGSETAVRTAQLLRDAGARDAVIVLSDDNASVPAREQNAGRIESEHGLSGELWSTFAAGTALIAERVRADCGIRTVFHPHCGGYVETPEEIDELMRRTDPSLLGLCVDTGHIVFGGGSPSEVLARHAGRVWHVHFKDCDPAVAADVRRRKLGYLAAVRARLFCELGRGEVAFAEVLAALSNAGYDGWIVVEQDVFPGDGTPAESARRSRSYLQTLGI
jgi:inosose dehydratase